MDGLKKSIEIEKERLSFVQIDNVATLYKCNVMFNELEQDLLVHIISKIENWGKPGEYAQITFNANTFLKITKRKTHAFDNIAKALEHLRDTPIRILENDYGSWLSWVTKEPKTSDFTVDFPAKMKSFLGYIEGLYVKFNADFIYRLIGSYSKKLYMILKAALKNKDSETLSIELPELKELLGIDDKYSKYNNFKTRVLLSAQKEINTKTDIDFSFSEIKSGHAVSSIEFDIFINKENKIDSSDENIIRTVLKQRGFFDTTIDAFIKHSHGDVTKMQKWENKANEILAKNQSENENENIVIDEELKNTILLEIAELNKKTEAEPKPKKEKTLKTSEVYELLKAYSMTDKTIQAYIKFSNNNVDLMQKWIEIVNKYTERKNITDVIEKNKLYYSAAAYNWEPERKPMETKQAEPQPKKADKVGYTYQKEKEFQKNKTVRVDERAMPEIVDKIPEKSEFQKDFEFTFLNELINYFETNKKTADDIDRDFALKLDVMQELITENEIDVIINTTQKEIIIYAHEFMITSFINARYKLSFSEVGNKCVPDGFNLDDNFRKIKYEVVYKIIKR